MMMTVDLICSSMYRSREKRGEKSLTSSKGEDDETREPLGIRIATAGRRLPTCSRTFLIILSRNVINYDEAVMLRSAASPSCWGIVYNSVVEGYHPQEKKKNDSTAGSHEEMRMSDS